MPNMPIEYATVSIEDLLPDVNNPRRHPQENMDLIQRSLEKFGQVEPLVVQKKTKMVIGGNGRIQAMKKLQWKTCNVAIVDVTDVEARELSVILNRSGELSHFDEGALAASLQELQDGGADIYSVGWEPSDVDALLDGFSGKLGDSLEEASNVPFPEQDREYDGPPQAKSIRLTDEQREVFEQAVALMREKEGDAISEGQAVQLLAADYLAGR